jgi:hypothetical protein
MHGLNICWETSCSNCYLAWFCWVPLGKCRDIILASLWLLPQQSLPMHQSSSFHVIKNNPCENKWQDVHLSNTQPLVHIWPVKSVLLVLYICKKIAEYVQCLAGRNISSEEFTKLYIMMLHAHVHVDMPVSSINIGISLRLPLFLKEKWNQLLLRTWSSRMWCRVVL